MSETRWAKLGLPEGMNLRVAIHAGPVYLGQDPVTGNTTCFGSNVNRAARIEPITPPGLPAFVPKPADFVSKDCVAASDAD